MDEQESLNDIILNYVHTLASFDSFEIAELFTEISDKYSSIAVKLKEFTTLVKPIFQKIKDEYNDLSGSEIPAIVYSGEEETLPEIFTLMNKEGTPLTDYEIYAASWPSKKFFVSNESIVEYVLKKYDCLNDDGYEVHGYDRDAIRKSKSLSSFEYVFGFSKYITNKYSILGFNSHLLDDETNPIAFQLINACFNSSHAQIKDLYSNILVYSDRIDKLEECLIKAIEFVDKVISPIIKFKGNTRNSLKIFHSQFQILSLISFSFREMFDSDLNEKETWKVSSSLLKNNIWKYYVYDVLVKYWSDGGTNKIHTCNNEKRYLTPLSKGMFSTAFDNYAEYCNNLEESRQVRNPNEKDYVILNTIYLNHFTAMDQLSIDAFDVEHIATKKQMKSLINKCNGSGLPISHIANICYLPEAINRKKRDLNFYQDDNYLSKTKYNLQDIENKYSFTQKQMLEWMDLNYLEGEFETLKNYYFDYISSRCKCVKDKFMIALGFSTIESEKDINKDEAMSFADGFTDSFFRLEKIGVMAKKSIEYLLKNNKLTSDDFENLKDKDYCKYNLGCAYPLFVYSTEAIKDHNGKTRYYAEPIKYNDTDIYICSQWFENDRKKLVPWIKERID